MVPNPWQVESIQAFYFLKCPECAFDTQDENCFQDHALEKHPLSCALFEIKPNEDIIENSTYQEHDVDTLISADHNYCENKISPSQNFMIGIKEEFRVDENDPLGFSNPITNDGEEFLDERIFFDYEGGNVPLSETFVELKKIEDNQNRQNKSSPKISLVKDEGIPKESIDIPKSPKSPKMSMTEYDIGMTDLSRKARDILKESVNISNEELHQCSICTKSFQSSRRLSIHVAAAHEEKKPIKCYICEVSFSERKLKAHFASAHGGNKPFKCTICDLSYSWKGYLKTHLKTVHEKKKPFKCSQCDACFSLNGTLENHIANVHEKKRPSLCSDCGKSFYSQGSLRNHISTVHEKKKPFICSHCSKSFALKGQLQKHTAAVHEGKKDFQCSLCGHCFSQKKDMKLHIASVHEGKKPYKCAKCVKSFSQNVNLKEHLLVVHKGKKPHQCSNCDASFSRKSKLKEHAVSVHKEV